jgi:hypothetical protein
MSAGESLPSEQTPGAMAVRLERKLPAGGVVEFESAPAGWLTRDGKPRAKGWRCYRYVAEPGAKPVRLPSVTTICSAVLPKDGLPPWSEARGIEGALEAIRRGGLSLEASNEEAVKTVRRLGLGADRARDDAADRGLNLHSILENFMHTGRAPNPSDHPEPHRPFIRGLVRWILSARPQPVVVEFLVADPDRGYAGRADLIARIGGRLTLIDLKSNPTGQIYDSAHIGGELLMPPRTERGRQIARANLRNAPAAPRGNQRARVHGAYAAIAAERLEAKTHAIFDALAADAPVRAVDGGLPREDSVVVRLLADALCRLDGIGEFLTRRGWQDDDGQPRAVLDVEARLRGQALNLAVELGMTPRSRAALGLDLVRAASAGDRLDEHLRQQYGGDAIDGEATIAGEDGEAS